ncbi:kinase-like protein, partial [Auricularia subglabra TFB-10046 SS5]
VVALKKSRCSARIKLPALQREARILRCLAGHRGVPEIYAYGRKPHFEYLTMQLLGQSLDDLVSNMGSLPITRVCDIADQLLDAMSHLHSHNIVHRDIKPSNVLVAATDSSHVFLVDYGHASPYSHVHGVEGRVASQGENALIGTLRFASLNAHNGGPLSFRDDLESLSYTLVYLIRAGLPWSHYAKGPGTPMANVAQVFRQKAVCDGTRLSRGIPKIFGDLLDYSRPLPFDQRPAYNSWRDAFARCPANANDPSPISLINAKSSGMSFPPTGFRRLTCARQL